MHLWHAGWVLGVMAVLIVLLHLSGRTDIREWRYRNLRSVRAWLASVVAAVVSVGAPTWLLSLVWSGFGYLFYSVYVLVALSMLAFMAPGNHTPLSCETCGGRVRISASVCQRCGHDHAAAWRSGQRRSRPGPAPSIGWSPPRPSSGPRPQGGPIQAP